MGDAAGEPADGVEPLGLAELFLALMQRGPRARALADVGGEDQPGPPAVQLQLVGDELHVHHGAVLALMPGEAPHPRGRAARPSAARAASSVGPDVHDGHGEEFVAGIAVVPHRRVVHREELERLHVEHPHRLGIGVEQQAVSAVGLAAPRGRRGPRRWPGEPLRQLPREAEILLAEAAAVLAAGPSVSTPDRRPLREAGT